MKIIDEKKYIPIKVSTTNQEEFFVYVEKKDIDKFLSFAKEEHKVIKGIKYK